MPKERTMNSKYNVLNLGVDQQTDLDRNLCRAVTIITNIFRMWEMLSTLEEYLW